jgi:O-antigen/teichoic acid export membrane protein
MRDRVSGSAAVKQVVHGGSVAFLIYVAAAGAAYCSQFVIARLVGVDSFGAYAYVTATMVVLAYFAALGFDVALLRFVPAYEAQSRWDLFAGIILYAQRRACAVGLIVVLIGISVVAVRSARMPLELRRAFFLGFLLVPILALLWIRCSAVRAFGGVVWAIVPDRLVREGLVIGLVAPAALGLGLHLDATQVVAAMLVSSGVGLALTSLAMRRLRPRVTTKVVPVYDAPAWRQAALPLLVIGGTEALMNRTGVLMLGWLGDIKAAGIYSLVFSVAFVAVLPRTALNTLFAPAVSSLFTRRDQAALQALVARASSWMLVAVVVIAIVLAALADPLLRWFGPGVEDGATALRILLLGQTLAASAGSQLCVMNMTGYERNAAALLVASAITNAIASAAFIRLFGLTGAAIATSLSLVLWNVAMALFLWRRLQLLPGVLALLQGPLASKSAPRAPLRALFEIFSSRLGRDTAMLPRARLHVEQRAEIFHQHPQLELAQRDERPADPLVQFGRKAVRRVEKLREGKAAPVDDGI